MLTIYVDADACPVKPEVYRVARRYGLRVAVVANAPLRVPANPLIELVVRRGFGAADDWIAGQAGPGDIVVTADIPLASRVLKNGASALGPTGKAFTADSIGVALGMRDFHRHLREATGGQTYNAGFARQDRSRFLNALENEIQAVRRRSGTSRS